MTAGGRATSWAARPICNLDQLQSAAGTTAKGSDDAEAVSIVLAIAGIAANWGDAGAVLRKLSDRRSTGACCAPLTLVAQAPAKHRHVEIQGCLALGDGKRIDAQSGVKGLDAATANGIESQWGPALLPPMPSGQHLHSC